MPELEHLAETIREPLRRFSAQIRELGKENAIGWALFGAVVAEKFDKSRHAVHSVLMLQSVELDLLKELSAEGAGYGRAGLAAPLVMTPPFLEASARHVSPGVDRDTSAPLDRVWQRLFQRPEIRGSERPSSMRT